MSIRCENVQLHEEVSGLNLDEADKAEPDCPEPVHQKPTEHEASQKSPEHEEKEGKDEAGERYSEEIIQTGSLVSIGGLQSKAGAQMNGKQGCVLAHIPEAGRYLVKVDGEKIKKRIKATNLKSVGKVVDLTWDDIVETAKLLKRPIPKPKEKKVDICKFVFGRQIGAGPNSRIVLATKNPDYDMGEDPSIERVALKVISKRSLTINRRAKLMQRALLCEKKTMYKCRGIHPYILDLYATSRGVEDVFFVMEYAPNNDLQHWAREQEGLPEPCVRFYTACIVDALQAMHKAGVFHRDVKPENVFLDKDFLPKLGDFGCSIEKGDVIDFMGTPQYMPPEMIRHQVNEETLRATDYWSLGATIFYLEFGELCFLGDSEYLIMIKSRDCDYKMPQRGDDTTKDLIRKLLVIDIKSRLGWEGGWEAVKRHSFFDGIDWEAIRKAKGPPVKFWVDEQKQEDIADK